jgi:hypothetical protein
MEKELYFHPEKEFDSLQRENAKLTADIETL